jgi:hypothetical protein
VACGDGVQVETGGKFEWARTLTFFALGLEKKNQLAEAVVKKTTKRQKDDV